MIRCYYTFFYSVRQEGNKKKQTFFQSDKKATGGKEILETACFFGKALI